MDFIGEAVLHKAFGKGIVIELENEYLKVQFDDQTGVKKFQYPNIFGQFLEAASKGFKKQIELDKKEFMQRQEQIKREQKTIRSTVIEPKPVSKPDAGRNKNRNKNKVPDIKNLAIKCTYCDGGAKKSSLGYRGVCSDSVIKHNIDIAKKVWCSQPDNMCNQYHQGLITRKELEKEYESTKNVFGQSICYESQMLQIWSAGAGFYHNGEREGQPMKLVHAGHNSLALLMTRKPQVPEGQRMIFAVFLVHENYQGDEQEEGHIGADKKYRLELKPKEAEKLKFWDYYFNPKNPQRIALGSGLHRYLTDQQGAQVLKEICRIKKGSPQEALAEEFFAHYCELKDLDVNHIAKPEGPMQHALIKGF